MARGYKERLALLHTKTSDNWWPFSVGYPFARRWVALTGDIRWITPNNTTLVSALCLFVGSLLLMQLERWADITAFVLLQAHVILDCADGTLARYRKESSALGAFLDKAADQAGFLLLGGAAGYRAFYSDGIGGGEPWIIVAGAVGAGCYVAVCYIYWVAAYFELQKRTDKEERSVVPGWEEHESEMPSLGQRLKEYIKGQWRIIHFNAPDFPFWVPFLVLLDRADVAVLGIVITQGITLIKKLIERSMAMARLDKEA